MAAVIIMSSVGRRTKRSVNMITGLFSALILAILVICPAASESIQLIQSGGVFMLPVRINDAVTIPFVLDSGAADVQIPTDVFLTLRRSGTVGQSDFRGTESYVTADGSRHSSDRFLLHTVTVGNHVITNVIANVAPVTGSALLGQSFLSRLPAWSVDNARHALALSDEDGLGIAGQAAAATGRTPLQRQETMRAQGRDMVAIKAFIDVTGDLAAAQGGGADLVRSLPTLPSLFPPNTGMTEFPGQTFVKPEAWSQRSTFNATVEIAVAKAQALSAALGTGDRARVVAAFGDLGKNGCGACHEAFRLKKG
jgi:cytochrome c556